MSYSKCTQYIICIMNIEINYIKNNNIILKWHIYFINVSTFKFLDFWMILLLVFTISNFLHFWTFGFLNISIIAFYFLHFLHFYFLISRFKYFPFWVPLSFVVDKFVVPNTFSKWIVVHIIYSIAAVLEVTFFKSYTKRRGGKR